MGAEAVEYPMVDTPPPSAPAAPASPASPAIDTRHVFAKLFSSQGFAFAALMLILVAILVAMGKAPYSELVSMSKWFGLAFMGGRTIEGGLAALRGPTS